MLACARFGRGWLAAVWILGCIACGDDDASPNGRSDAGERDASGPDGLSGRGGRGGQGGRSGSSGGGSGGGVAGAPSTIDPSAYMCEPKPGDTGGPGESGAACCSGLGTCSGVAIGANAGMPHDTCKAQPDLRCAPNPPAADEDAGTPAGFAGCRVMFPGAPPTAASFEGRCLPDCFVKHSPIVSRLSRGTCAEAQTCMPCYNPLNGRSTGACEQPGDSPLDPAPPGFVECSGGAGYCVPAFAAGSQAAQLSQLTCAAGELCGPKIKVADPDACFPRCDAGLYGSGACAPDFLAGPAAALLNGLGCNMGELCIPCVALGTRTGVCD